MYIYIHIHTHNYTHTHTNIQPHTFARDALFTNAGTHNDRRDPGRFESSEASCRGSPYLPWGRPSPAGGSFSHHGWKALCREKVEGFGPFRGASAARMRCPRRTAGLNVQETSLLLNAHPTLASTWTRQLPLLAEQTSESAGQTGTSPRRLSAKQDVSCNAQRSSRPPRGS